MEALRPHPSIDEIPAGRLEEKSVSVSVSANHQLKIFSREAQLPVLENPCPPAKNTKRQYIKNLIKKLDEDHRGLKENIFKAMKHVKPDYLLKE
jgi:hypothetical protein